VRFGLLENPYRKQSKVNPQRDRGRREIANDVFHALMNARLSGGEYQATLTVIDRTWGFEKLSAPISLTFFTTATGLSRQGVIDAIKGLESKHIIVANRNGTKATEYLFNKHYDTWELPLVKQSGLADGKALVNQGLPDKSSRVDQSSQVGLTSTSQVVEPSTEATKENIKETFKETLKEKGRSSTDLTASTPASKYLFEKTGRKRWQNLVQKEKFEKAEAEVGVGRMKGAIDWALTSGISNIKSIITAARRETSGVSKRKRQPARAGSGSHRGPDQAPTREQYLRSLEK